MAIAHQIRLEIGREKASKTTVYPYSSSHHFGVMHDDFRKLLIILRNKVGIIKSHHKVITKKVNLSKVITQSPPFRGEDDDDLR